MDRGEKTGRAALRSRGSDCSTFMEVFFPIGSITVMDRVVGKLMVK